MICPNKNLKSFQDLVEAVGENKAYTAFFRNENDIPTVEQANELLYGKNIVKSYIAIEVEKLPSVPEQSNNIKPGVEELFNENFLIFAEAKNAEEAITKLINNNVIEKKCS